MRKTIKLRENKRAESRKSIAQGNALCNELHPSPSSPERAKSFVNNRLRPVRGCVKNAPKTIEVVIDRNPRSNEVLPRPNENNMSVERWNNLLILTCHPYGILLTANIFSTDISSLRDFLSYTNKWENSTFVIKKSRRDDISVEENRTFAIKKSRRDDISVKKNRVEMENVLKINAGIACSDRANEVEPRPNGGNVTINAVIASAAKQSRNIKKQQQ